MNAGTEMGEIADATIVIDGGPRIDDDMGPDTRLCLNDSSSEHDRSRAYLGRRVNESTRVNGRKPANQGKLTNDFFAYRVVSDSDESQRRVQTGKTPQRTLHDHAEERGSPKRVIIVENARNGAIEKTQKGKNDLAMAAAAKDPEGFSVKCHDFSTPRNSSIVA